MANPDPTPISPADAMASLKLSIDLVNSERQAIWARMGAMLVANSFIINAIGSFRLESSLGITFAAVGFLLCIIWALMVWDGWGWFYQFMLDGKKIAVDPRLNPFARVEDLGIRSSDRMFRCAIAIPGIFSVLYLIAILHFAGKGV
jgi:hypothetical protein